MSILADMSKVGRRTKIKITPKRAKYIRSNMDKSLKELQDKTDLSKYVIKIIQEAKRNNFFRQRAGETTKYDKLTDEMKTYLKTVEFEFYKDMASKFNRTFSLSDLTPLHKQTLKRYRRKLLAEEGEI